jgi:hypothetical protein
MNLDPTRRARKILKIALFISISLGLVLVVLLLIRQPTVSADSVDIAAVEARYPNMAGSRIDTCDLCHTSSIPNLNPYGAVYKSAGRSAAALAAIDGNDTDGDGFTNGTEFVARTFPGDANNHPSADNAVSLTISLLTTRPGNTQKATFDPTWDRAPVSLIRGRHSGSSDGYTSVDCHGRPAHCHARRPLSHRRHAHSHRRPAHCYAHADRCPANGNLGPSDSNPVLRRQLHSPTATHTHLRPAHGDQHVNPGPGE